jgi:hypothetical protein
MVPSTLTCWLSFAATGALVFLATASAPAYSGDRPVRLGPVRPDEPIMTMVGNKDVIAFYRPADGHCDVYIVTCDRNDDSGHSAQQVRVSLNPRQIIHIDAANHTLNLQCADNATTLALVDTDGRIVSGTNTLDGQMR